MQTTTTSPLLDWDLFWSPSGKRLTSVRARTEQEAIRKTPAPWSRYRGEVYAQQCDGAQRCTDTPRRSKPLSQVYHGTRNLKAPYSLIIRHGTRAGAARSSLEVILAAVRDFPTKQEAEKAREGVREDLRPYVDINQFGGWL